MQVEISAIILLNGRAAQGVKQFNSASLSENNFKNLDWNAFGNKTTSNFVNHAVTNFNFGEKLSPVANEIQGKLVLWN